MKIRKLPFLIALSTIMLMNCGPKAQQTAIYPTPQAVEWGETAVNHQNGYTILNAQSADPDAVRVLSENLSISPDGIKVTVAQRGDAEASAYEQFVPTQAEGYYLSVKNGEVIIVGNDSRGAFYGAQTLLQLAQNEYLTDVTITDYPSVIERGMIEGYYGNPLSFQDRVSQFEFYGRNKMNIYIYGPKDDPYHGFSTRWREFYPEKEAKLLSQLVDEAAKNKVQFVWSLHPGRDIKWTQEDREATIRKFESVYDLGVRSFAVFFDDISGNGTNPTEQAEYLNYVQKEFVDKKKDVTPLIMCPTQYNQAWTSGDYLDILGSELHPEIRIMWTGKSVCRMIDHETMEWINKRIGRNAYVWLNYPVTDYAIDKLLMGPLVGNEQNIASQLSGFVSNPMEYGEASKVALFSIADYTWNMTKFDPNASWLAALEYIMPENYEAFKIFCENNVDIGISYHGLRMPNESAAFAKDTVAFWNGYSPEKYDETAGAAILNHLKTFRDASAELLQSTYNPNLTKEIKPWLEVFDLVSQKGELLIGMQESLADKDSVEFIAQYKKVKELSEKQKTIISRDFEGTIKVANPKPANEVVVAFFAELQNKMFDYYRQNYNYELDVLPGSELEGGRYYITAHDKYLSNVAGNSVRPLSLMSEKDNINPQRQEWRVEYSPLYESYIIRNVQDGSYLNRELKVDGRRFLPIWHPVKVIKSGDKYAIGWETFLAIDEDGNVSGEKSELPQERAIFTFTQISK